MEIAAALLAGYDNWLDSAIVHSRTEAGLHYIDFSGPEDELLRDPDVKRYTMVRDPYSRVLSAYLNKVENRLPWLYVEADNENHFKKVAREIDSFRRNALGEVSFPEVNLEVFLRWIRESNSKLVLDGHWLPQAILLRQPEVEFDIVGRFERLDEDSATILAAIGCDQRFPSQKETKFEPTNAMNKLRRYYNDAAVALVNEIYGLDFEAFGYELQHSAGFDA